MWRGGRKYVSGKEGGKFTHILAWWGIMRVWREGHVRVEGRACECGWGFMRVWNGGHVSVEGGVHRYIHPPPIPIGVFALPKVVREGRAHMWGEAGGHASGVLAGPRQYQVGGQCVETPSHSHHRNSPHSTLIHYHPHHQLFLVTAEKFACFPPLELPRSPSSGDTPPPSHQLVCVGAGSK